MEPVVDGREIKQAQLPQLEHGRNVRNESASSPQLETPGRKRPLPSKRKRISKRGRLNNRIFGGGSGTTKRARRRLPESEEDSQLDSETSETESKSLTCAACLVAAASADSEDLPSEDEEEKEADANLLQAPDAKMRIEASKYGMKGCRKHMQDASSLCLGFVLDGHDKPGPWSFAGVYDGHGGTSVSFYLKQTLHRVIQQEIINAETGTPMEKIFERSFLKIDRKLCAEHSRCGSCAIVCLIHHPTQELWIANVGDSRAVLSRGGRAVSLSTIQKPTNPVESARIKRAGGFIFRGRVNGELAVSRAFGDGQFKEDGGETVSVRPEVRHLRLSSSDEYLILGCDGLFDVMSDESVVGFVSSKLEKAASVKGVGVALVEHAVNKLRSRDNVSVVVLRFVRNFNVSEGFPGPVMGVSPSMRPVRSSRCSSLVSSSSELDQQT
mmetsp:Transcript_6914/g.8434  ORF Transcript_6914/g.8434 Transcript_6914/m.8434 type:complete len:440 (+) Transcript_6914:114-1433(+)